MTKCRMPTAAELEAEYGKWEKNPAIKEVANWGLPNSSKEFKEAESIDYLEKINPEFEKASEELFG